MLDSVFAGLFDTTTTTVISPVHFLACLVVSLVLGVFLAWVYMYRSHYTRSFVVTLALLPAVVCVVILMVNGNVGTGVAVAGAFSLVRFRSVPGTAREIGAIFVAMGTGLIAGMGYLAYAALFSVVIGAAMVAFELSGLGARNGGSLQKTLRITVPEDLDYSGMFDDLFARYTASHELVDVRTTNMGSLYRLTYDITLSAADIEKPFIDELRCRNGNLEILICRQAANGVEL